MDTLAGLKSQVIHSGKEGCKTSVRRREATVSRPVRRHTRPRRLRVHRVEVVPQHDFHLEVLPQCSSHLGGYLNVLPKLS